MASALSLRASSALGFVMSVTNTNDDFDRKWPLHGNKRSALAQQALEYSQKNRTVSVVSDRGRRDNRIVSVVSDRGQERQDSLGCL